MIETSATRLLGQVFLLLLALVAQLVYAQPREELLLWHGYRGEERRALEQLLEDYNRNQPDARVKALAVPFGSFADKLSAALPRGQGPDLFIFGHDRIGGWARAGNTVAPVDDLVPARVLARFPPSLVEAMRFEGRLYGLPFNFKSTALIYNRALVRHAPETTDELLALARARTDRRRGRFGLAYSYTEPFFHGALLNSFGSGPFDADGRLALDSPGNVRSLEQLARWVREEGILPEEPNSTLVTNLFNQGRAAMVISGPWLLGEISEGIDYAVAPLPQNSESGRPLAPWVAVEGLFLSPWSGRQQAALGLMNYLTGERAALHMAMAGGQLPANLNAYTHPEVARDANTMAFRRQLETAVPIPNLPQMTLLWKPLEKALNKVVKGSASPAGELQRLQREIRRDVANLQAAGDRAGRPRSIPAWAWLGLALLALAALSPALRRRRRIAAAWREHRTAYVYILPAMLGMLLLVFFPLLYGFLLSFTDTTLLNENTPFLSRWQGLGNYASILGDWNFWYGEGAGRSINYDNFYWTLLVTICWTAGNVVLSVGLALVLALALDKPILGRTWFRLLLILPWAIPNYITALVWKGMFHPQFGVVNQALQVVGLAPVAWFDSVGASFMTGLVTNVWLSIPFMMVVILGGLQSIPRDLYEAARVEGAGRWCQFRAITLPLLKPVLVPAIILSVVWTFNMFNVIYLVSDGAPAGANDILITKAFRIGFEKYQYAYAAAYSMVILALLFAYAMWQMRVSRTLEAAR
ncbi:extracellular solute-binding protein [Microbulbifer yueqingensis]|uniref:Carbohydrate ABC transporter substrate-binding protein, CUT1 family /carbohydrate ABC transporter membrane protein 1, CUT1 family n=1 Tax=Microbulbifer yueqingensis TaxID=658219 RepID=A0A1G8Y901_9GAMM|nr:extracellular solute-binding protein [Microbulbifer yueqingensis]SDJ99201.1 carbohydrate ABC transporter substrate-binding protein, CUT1 family /carbohydrate ABC transporter membrane protein 1, CUT1 family [Microbulbifer yueqingensis]